MKYLLLMAALLLPTKGFAMENIGKVCDPCKGWIYFQDKEINWEYEDGKKINGIFYMDWQIIMFDKIKVRMESQTNMVEELTKAMKETERIKVNCNEEAK